MELQVGGIAPAAISIPRLEALNKENVCKMIHTRGLRFGRHVALKMAETSLGIPLGAAKSRSRALFFGSKTAPRGLHEAKTLEEESKRPHGSDFDPSGTLRTSKIIIFGMKFRCCERPVSYTHLTLPTNREV